MRYRGECAGSKSLLLRKGVRRVFHDSVAPCEHSDARILDTVISKIRKHSDDVQCQSPAERIVPEVDYADLFDIRQRMALQHRIGELKHSSFRASMILVAEIELFWVEFLPQSLDPFRIDILSILEDALIGIGKTDDN